MSDLARLFQEGGLAMYGLLLLAPLATGALLAGVILAAIRRWSPAPLWWGLPLLAAMVGAAGWLLGLLQVERVMPLVSPDARSAILHTGASEALVPAMSALALGSGLLLLGALGAGLGLLLGARPGQNRPAAGGIAMLGGLGGAILVGAAALLQPHAAGRGLEVVVLPLLVAAGGVALGMALWPAPAESPTSEHAPGAPLVASLVAGSIALAWGAAFLQAQHALHAALGRADPEAWSLLVPVAWASARAWCLPGALALALALLGGAAACAPDLGRLAAPRSLASGGITALAVLAALGALAGGWYRHTDLVARTQEVRLDRALAHTPDLPRPVPAGSTEWAAQRTGEFSAIYTWENGAWHPADPDAELPPKVGEIPLLMAPASLSVGAMVDIPWAGTAAMPEKADLEIALARQGEAAPTVRPWGAGVGFGVLRLELVPSSLAGDGQTVRPANTLILGASGVGLGLFQGQGQFRPVEDLRALFADLPPAFSGEGWPVLLVPAATWTLQDLVGWCLALQAVHPSERCTVTGTDSTFLATAESPLAPTIADLAEPDSALAEALRTARIEPPWPPYGRGDQPAPARGAAEVGGTLSSEVISRIIRRNMDRIKYCYERTLQVQPALAGRVTARFEIGPDGSVIDARITDSTLSNADVETCLVARFRAMQFPAPEGGGVVAVTYPLVFTVAD